MSGDPELKHFPTAWWEDIIAAFAVHIAVRDCAQFDLHAGLAASVWQAPPMQLVQLALSLELHFHETLRRHQMQCFTRHRDADRRLRDCLGQ